MNEFYVGAYRVDMSRSQIVAQEHIVSMEPKVLQVLHILAKNQGQVVAHETILAEVWPDVVVAPNALQRCIAQLRKAFGDDAKAQQVIATHPKVGYSLLLNVDWHNEAQVNGTNKSDSSSKRYSGNGAWRLALPIFAIVAMLVVGLTLFQAKEGLPLSRLTALTTTDSREFFPSFSPDGRYIAFQRYIKACQSQVWVKDLNDDSEFLVTEKALVYGPPMWSADSRQLAFSAKVACSEDNPSKGCSSVHAVSFTLAKTKPQPTREVLACGEFGYAGVNWMGNDKLIFVAAKPGEGQVQSLSLNSGKIETLYQQPGVEPYALAYSTRFKKAAVTVYDQQKSMDLVIIDGITGQFERVKMKVPALHAAYNAWDPSWMPNEESLLVSSGSTVFKLKLDGSFEAYPVPTFEDIYTPIVHPDGSKIVATMGILDVDIGEYFGLNDEIGQAQSIIKHRSIVEDRQAKYRPDSNDISFVSKRDKQPQIYLEQQGRLRRLSHWSKTQVLSDYIWSPDGEYVVALVDAQLNVLALDGQAVAIETPFKAIKLYQWVDHKTLLLSSAMNNALQVMAYNINTGEYSVVFKGYTQWAAINQDGSLFYTDNHPFIKRFVEGQSLTFAPAAEHSTRQAFFIRNNKLLLVDQIQRMWSIDIATGSAEPFPLLPIGDIYWTVDDWHSSGNRFLYSTVHAARKEIVLFE